MENKLWMSVVVVLGVLGFLAGYIISSSTGVEPGFFEAVETGSYGSSSAAEVTEGISAEDQEYYRQLQEQ